ncbi:MAG TPA: DUF1801 domain-containing protein [Opitutaceae bacterium]|jgi:uncharacterized protein YdhG (YjbR/CyaY superfamily)|nr:DUF1801 domain-containing protein [Opitutaceae bacterium]
MKKSNPKSEAVVPGGIPEYIARCPKDVQGRLKDMRAAIRAAAPGAIETVSYFDIPGYSYPGYDYNGMFAWFSYKPPYVRLHIRLPALAKYKKEIAQYPQTKSVVSFPAEQPLPKALVQKLVKASVKAMKDLAG